MRVARTIDEVRRAVAAARGAGKRVGLVPTMGALHVGHVSLIEAAAERCDFVVVSIFVNPTQFGLNEDLEKYPRPFEQDVAMCEDNGADLVFGPTPEEMYGRESVTWVTVEKLTAPLCGRSRPTCQRSRAIPGSRSRRSDPRPRAWPARRRWGRRRSRRPWSRPSSGPRRRRAPTGRRRGSARSPRRPRAHRSGSTARRARARPRDRPSGGPRGASPRTGPGCRAGPTRPGPGSGRPRPSHRPRRAPRAPGRPGRRGAATTARTRAAGARRAGAG